MNNRKSKVSSISKIKTESLHSTETYGSNNKD